MQHHPQVVFRNGKHPANVFTLHFFHFAQHKHISHPPRQFAQAIAQRAPKFVALKGGLGSEWPGCRPSDLVPSGTNPYGYNAQGNLKVMTDFRSVYQSVIQEWLGDPRGIAPQLLGHTAQDPVRALVRGDGMTGPKTLFQ